MKLRLPSRPGFRVGGYFYGVCSQVVTQFAYIGGLEGYVGEAVFRGTF